MFVFRALTAKGCVPHYKPHLPNLVWSYWRQLTGEWVWPTSLPLIMLKEDSRGWAGSHTRWGRTLFGVQDITLCLSHVWWHWVWQSLLRMMNSLATMWPIRFTEQSFNTFIDPQFFDLTSAKHREKKVHARLHFSQSKTKLAANTSKHASVTNKRLLRFIKNLQWSKHIGSSCWHVSGSGSQYSWLSKAQSEPPIYIIVNTFLLSWTLKMG